jgi:hypothetical protein
LPTVAVLERFLGFTPAQRQRTILRTDAGFGSDANINHVLAADWQVLTKNKGGRRPDAWAQRVPTDAWQDVDSRRQIAPLPQPLAYCRPTQAHLLRWWTDSGIEKHAILVCSVPDWSYHELTAYYDQRGACEKEIQSDKVGLRLEKRRKKHLLAQEALILMTDVAHNLLAWAGHWMFPTGSLHRYGPLRLIEDVLYLPGRLIFDGERLSEVHLNALHPHASSIAAGLERLFEHFGHP